jgi:hypothetical protein
MPSWYSSIPASWQFVDQLRRLMSGATRGTADRGASPRPFPVAWCALLHPGRAAASRVAERLQFSSLLPVS